MRYVHLVSAGILFGFILGSFKGYVALWQDTGDEPIQIFPYSVEMFPDADRAALENGIHVRSEIELNQIMEEYLS